MASEKFGNTEGNGKALLSGSGIVDRESGIEPRTPNPEPRIINESEEMVEYKEGLMDIPEETINAFGGDELRARVFYEKYALRNEKGKIVEKTPEEMWQRVAGEIASPEKGEKLRKEWEEKFFLASLRLQVYPRRKDSFRRGAEEKGYPA
jgi:Ribonucleotide reductase, alpha subunit